MLSLKDVVTIKIILQNQNVLQDIGGGCEIRTHGGHDPITGFQDQLHKPLGQPSVFGAMFSFLRESMKESQLGATANGFHLEGLENAENLTTDSIIPQTSLPVG